MAIITFNEERNLARTLEALQPLSKNIIVVDSESTDQTEEICKRFGTKFITKKWSGFASQKQFAINQLSSEWILALDADEVVTPELVEEIKKALENPSEIKGFKIPRKLHFLGKVQHHGKGVDTPLRLFKKNHGKYNQREIHEEIVVEGEISSLVNAMIHYSSESISDRIRKIRRDNHLELIHYNQGQGSLWRLAIFPFKNLYFNIIKRQAYRDGMRGIILSILFSYQLLDHELRLFKNRGENR